MTNHTEAGELKPCPFCGGDELSHGWSAPGVDGSATTGEVECHDCNVLLYRGSEAEAIAVWNRRPNTPDEVMADQEPVAWMYEHPSDGIYVSPVKRHLHPGWTETPLYAAPPASMDRNAVLEAAAKAAYDALHPHPNHPESDWTEYAHAHAAAARKASAAIRALRTEAPAQGGE